MDWRTSAFTHLTPNPSGFSSKDGVYNYYSTYNSIIVNDYPTPPNKRLIGTCLYGLSKEPWLSEYHAGKLYMIDNPHTNMFQTSEPFELKHNNISSLKTLVRSIQYIRHPDNDTESYLFFGITSGEFGVIRVKFNHNTGQTIEITRWLQGYHLSGCAIAADNSIWFLPVGHSSGHCTEIFSLDSPIFLNPESFK